MKGIASICSILSFSLLSVVPAFSQCENSFSCAGFEAPEALDRAAKILKRARRILPSKGQIKVLVVFAQFRDEAQGSDSIPAYADGLFDPVRPGSFTHFYHTMSFGQLQVEGTVLPKRYTSDRPVDAYRVEVPGEEDGHYDEFAQEILQKVDQDVDLGQFDSDGSDGVPDSGDDDGYVDYVFINMHSTPRGFIRDGATGIAGLGLDADFLTADISTSGEPIRIRGSRANGAILQEGSLTQTVGSMAHEFGHGLGLPDFYDLVYGNPEEDSGGIGRWGLMGWGAHGWQGDDGPNPLCAWSRERLGWIGRENERLMEVEGDEKDLLIADLHQGGYVIRVPLGATVLDGGFLEQEYLLLEQRTREGHYYNRHLPADGLLIWRIRPYVHITHGQGHNDQEEAKVVDLVCADGLYRDRGYPQGGVPDPYRGRDNLDFWAHDAEYRQVHAGNLGDATDPFDGIHFTDFNAKANPSSNFDGNHSIDVASDAAIRNIRSKGKRMIVDIELSRWAGIINGEVHWAGDIIVDGDVTVAPQGKLVIHDNTRVRFAGWDRLTGGRDAALCELRIEGELQVSKERLYRLDAANRRRVIAAEGIELAALVQGEVWYGISVNGLDEARADYLEEAIIVRDAEYGFSNQRIESASLDAGWQTGIFAGAGDYAEGFALLPNHPNPFNPETTIPFLLSDASQVRLVVYNTLGQTVRILVDDYRPQGMQAAVWDARDEIGQVVAGGVYLYRLEIAGRFTQSGRMLRVR